VRNRGRENIKEHDKKKKMELGEVRTINDMVIKQQNKMIFVSHAITSTTFIVLNLTCRNSIEFYADVSNEMSFM